MNSSVEETWAGLRMLQFHAACSSDVLPDAPSAGPAVPLSEMSSTPRHGSFVLSRASLETVLDRAPSALLDALRQSAGEAGWPVYLVGGPLRDALLRRPVRDLDFAVEGDAPALAAALAEKTGARLTTHPRFGTATVELDEAQLDLVTARREEYPHPGALPVVAAGSMADDLARRDFSINAMAFPISRSESGLLDPHGGLADLADGLVRVLHPASFVDDPTRVFRAVRYARRLGFTVEPGTLERLNEAVFAGALATVSGDRLRRELERIFAEDRPAEALEAAAELGVLSAIHPALGRREVTGALRKAGALPAVPPSFWLVAISYHLTPGEGESLVQCLNLTKEQSRLVRDTIWLRENEDAVRRAAATPSRLAAALGGIHPEALAAAAPLTGDPVVSRVLAAHNARLQGDRAGISGDDLLDMGLARGPAVGAVLGQLRDARLDGLVTTPEEERILARKLISLVADRGLPPNAERTGE